MLLDTLGGFITEPRGQVLEDYDGHDGQLLKIKFVDEQVFKLDDN